MKFVTCVKQVGGCQTSSWEAQAFTKTFSLLNAWVPVVANTRVGTAGLWG